MLCYVYMCQRQIRYIFMCQLDTEKKKRERALLFSEVLSLQPPMAWLLFTTTTTISVPSLLRETLVISRPAKRRGWHTPQVMGPMEQRRENLPLSSAKEEWKVVVSSYSGRAIRRSLPTRAADIDSIDFNSIRSNPSESTDIPFVL